MRTHMLAILLAFIGAVGVTRGCEPADEQEYETLRSFARKELDSNLIHFTPGDKEERVYFTPGGEEVRDHTLVFSFDKVNDVDNVDPAIVLQFRVELLRKFPLFGEKETKNTITELETVVQKCLATRKRLDREFASRPNPKIPTREFVDLKKEQNSLVLDFEQILKKYAMDYAEQHRLNLQIGDAFGDGDYLYIDKKRRNRRDVPYEEAKEVVAAQFDRDRVDFVRPYIVIVGRSAQFYRGQILGLEGSKLAIADLFGLELLRRHPNVSKEVFDKHVGAIEDALKKQYSEQMSLSLSDALSGSEPFCSGSFVHPAYHGLLSRLLYDVEGGEAHAMNMGTSITLDSAPTIATTVLTYATVDRIVYCGETEYHLSNDDMAKVPISRRWALQPGDGVNFLTGTYMYQLKLREGGVIVGSFDIPKAISRDGKLTLR